MANKSVMKRVGYSSLRREGISSVRRVASSCSYHDTYLYQQLCVDSLLPGPAVAWIVAGDGCMTGVRVCNKIIINQLIILYEIPDNGIAEKDAPVAMVMPGNFAIQEEAPRAV